MEPSVSYVSYCGVLTLFLALALVCAFRMACLSRTAAPGAWWHWLCGLWLGAAAWCLGALLQAWVPLWEMLTFGLALELIVRALPLGGRPAGQLLADSAVVLVLAPLSVVPVAVGKVAFAAALFAVAGCGLDVLTRRLAVHGRRRVVALAVCAVLVLGLNVRQMSDFGWRTFAREPAFVLRLALATPQPGTPVRLASGAVAWMLRTPAEVPRGTALLLHGNHPLASRQPAAIALQGALMLAGYDVLSVDHPAFGASRMPDPSDWTQWDPTIGPKLALRYLSAIGTRGSELILAGHSMGVDVALKLLLDGAAVSRVYLFGGSLDHATAPEARWIRAFYNDRRLPCCVPVATLRSIRDHFYSGADRFTLALPGAHPVVHFIRFGVEYEDVARDRDPLYATISAPKTACDLDGMSHYFNTLSIGELVLVDTRTVIRTAGLLGGSDATCAAAAAPRQGSS